MADDTKSLLVIEHRVKLSKQAIASIEAAGFTVVRGTPADFNVVSTKPQITNDLVARVAMETIQSYARNCAHSNHLRWDFARNLVIALGYGDMVKMG